MARKATAIPEDKNHYVYIWFYILTKVPVYVGEGSGGRVTGRHFDDLEKLRNEGLVDFQIVADKLTKGQAETLETELLNSFKDLPLLNKQGGKSSSVIDIYEPKQSIEDNITSVIEGAIHTGYSKDQPTPSPIIHELINSVAHSPNFDPKGKDYINLNCRFGEFYTPLHDKIGADNIKNRMTMVDKTANLVVFLGSRNLPEDVKMNEVICINHSFADWSTENRYDVAIMNPPFNKFGEPFIIKSAGLLNNNGYLAVVMSQYWRSIGRDPKKALTKTYNILRMNGGFHMIHMYSAKDTTEMFKRSIGQVDTFVWQKGAKINNTKVINGRGDEYFCDLNNYPQAPPVLPPYIYNQYFDQTSNLRWLWNTHLTDSNTIIDVEFEDIITGKTMMCNQRNVELTKVPKIMFDTKLNQLIIDEKGEYISNGYRFYPITNNEDKNSVIRSLTFIMDNGYKDLFMNKDNVYIPNIKR